MASVAYVIPGMGLGHQGRVGHQGATCKTWVCRKTRRTSEFDNYHSVTYNLAV
jgi:hypothetical protein